MALKQSSKIAQSLNIAEYLDKLKIVGLFVGWVGAQCLRPMGVPHANKNCCILELAIQFPQSHEYLNLNKLQFARYSIPLF